MKKYDYIILGGGISGLAFARLLQLHTDKTFLILEKESEVGGLCRTKEIDGNHFDIGGGHFLHSKYHEVYDFIFSHIPESAFNKFDRVTKIQLDENLIDFPIEENIWQLPKEKQEEYVNSLIDSIDDDLNEDISFKSWIYSKFGKRIADDYLLPYNEKIWGTDLTTMSTDWLYKIPKPELKSIIKSIIYARSNKENLPSHSYFYYPKEGGFSRIIEAIYGKLKDHVSLRDSIIDIDENTNNEWIVNNKYTCDKIINTIPWSCLPNILSYHKIKQISQLKRTSLVVSFIKDPISCSENVCHYHNYHWKYIPDITIPYHREFRLSNYVLSNKNKFISYETNLNRYIPADEISFVNEFAYPIPLKGKDVAIQQILNYYEAINVYGLGRWGTWQYHNSDVCIRQAMDLLNKLENAKL